MANGASPQIEFMKHEYTGICNAFGDLYNVILKVFNFYLLLAAVPFTVAAIIYKTTESQFDLKNLPLPMSVLFLLISILGLLVAFSMAHLRMEQILYARTINCIRRYFCEIDTSPGKNIDDYLSLPTTDELPPFLELGRFFFWQLILIGLVDTVYEYLALINLFGLAARLSGIISSFFFLFHPLGYIVAAVHRSKNYKVKCSSVPNRKENY